jgi:hypothetical protein
MKKISFFASLVIVCFLFSWKTGKPINNSTTYDSLKRGFIDPPSKARPKVYWWWLNGYVDKGRILEELTAMKNAGIAGMDIFEIGVPKGDTMIPAGPAFMGDESLETIRYAIQEAGKLKLEVGLNMASSWNAGGSWTLPVHAAKSLYFSTVKVKGPAKEKINLPFPKIFKGDDKGNNLIPTNANGKPAYYEEVAVLAIPAGIKNNTLDTGKIINLSRYFNSNTEIVDYKLPDGEWEIYRYVSSNSGEQLKLPSPNSKGPIIDHFDSSATRAHFLHIINRLKSVLGNFNNTALKSLYLASYEATGTVWTSTLPVEFRKNHGYDVHKLIPAMFNKELFDTETTDRFQADLKKTLSELMINNFYRKAKQVSNSFGLKINSEAGGPGQPLHNVPAEPLKALGSLDIPRGEFWNKHHIYNKDSVDVLQVVKEVAAASHIYNRGIVEEESFTSFEHWQEGPFELKPLADRAFCEGMNKVVVHGFSHNPKGAGFPGFVYHAGTHFNDKRVWWTKVRPFNDYLARVSYVLQETKFVADVVYYYGDKVPNSVTAKNTSFKVGTGYDYEVINTDVLLHQLLVKDGLLVLPNGAKFRILSLAGMDEVNPQVLKKIQKLAAAGAIITGTKPAKAVGLIHQLKGDEAVKNTANQLWTNTRSTFKKELIGKGKVFTNLSPLKIFQGLGVVPDLDYSGSDKPVIDYIHTTKGDVDFYYIRNTTGKPISRLCAFRQQNKVPEIWDPVTGEVVAINIYDAGKQQTKIPISLPAYGSYFIVFKNGRPVPHYISLSLNESDPPFIKYTKNGIQLLGDGVYRLGEAKKIQNKVKIASIEGAWKVGFTKGWGAPDSATFPTLMSWTESGDKGIKYYAGTATYQKTFSYYNNPTVHKGDQLYLDLGNISKVAEVWLNGERLGITWAQPYNFNVTGLVRNGENELKVEVANVWSNRLTGDAITGEKFTNTNIAISSRGVKWAVSPLVVSGLLGPVTIQLIKTVK